jgi:pilus assembly protein Flp/PilA
MRWIGDEGGTTAIEYALIGSLVSIAVVVALSQLGSELTVFYEVVEALVGDSL